MGIYSPISLSILYFSGTSPMKLQMFLRVTSRSLLFTPYSFIRLTSLSLTVLVHRTREQRILSMVSTAARPSLRRYKQSLLCSSSLESLPTFWRYSLRSQNSFYSLANLFSVNLLSTLSLQISLVDRTIMYKICNTDSSIDFCYSKSQPFNPCLSMMGNRYFNAPKSMSSSMILVSASSSAAVKELAMALRAGMEQGFLARMNCSMISLPFIEWQISLDFCSQGEGLIRSTLRQSKRLLRYYCQSLLAGDLERQGRTHSIRISIPNTAWNFSCALREWDSTRTSTSLLTNLLSSMTLCLTKQLGMMRLARQSKILVSLTRNSTALSHSSRSVSMILRICRATSYSSTLFSSSILDSVSTKLSKMPFSISQIFMRQYTSYTPSSAGSSEINSWRNSMHLQLISELGWLSILRTGRRMLDSMRRGMCYWVAYCRSVRMLSIYYSDWQNFMGQEGYFMRRVMLDSQREDSCYCQEDRVDRVIAEGPSSCILQQFIMGRGEYKERKGG